MLYLLKARSTVGPVYVQGFDEPRTEWVILATVIPGVAQFYKETCLAEDRDDDVANETVYEIEALNV